MQLNMVLFLLGKSGLGRRAVAGRGPLGRGLFFF